jgi:putative NADH-flavin reductase
VKILIIGASKGIGLATTTAALAAGYEVRAFARSAADMTLSDPRLEKMPGDATHQQDVEAALADVDAVIATLGVGLGDLIKPVHRFSDATRVIVAAMTEKSVKRLVCVTGFGAGDSWASIGVLQRVPFQIVFGRAYDDKTRQEDLIKQSGLDWTIARPGVLLNGPKSSRYKVLRDPASWRNGIISRASVADFLVKQIEDRTYLREAPILIN